MAKKKFKTTPKSINRCINSLVYSEQEILHMKRNNYRYSQHGCISKRKIWIEICHCALKDIYKNTHSSSTQNSLKLPKYPLIPPDPADRSSSKNSLWSPEYHSLGLPAMPLYTLHCPLHLPQISQQWKYLLLRHESFSHFSIRSLGELILSHNFMYHLQVYDFKSYPGPAQLSPLNGTPGSPRSF